jgi:mannose-1-phosphate guanylyltransferase
MKIIIFAGGSGRRLWPISRQKSPKQFEPIIGSQSTLQLAVGRVEESYGAENIFVSTNERYLDIIAGQLPQLPPQNLIGEPARRDLAAAVGLAMIHLAASPTDRLQEEPVAILWGDNYMDNVAEFLGVMETAESLLAQDEANIIFVGETPRFANDNLGWIGLGDKLGRVGERPYYRFNSLTYRPPLEVPTDACPTEPRLEYGLFCDNYQLCVTTIPGTAAGNVGAVEPDCGHHRQRRLPGNAG